MRTLPVLDVSGPPHQGDPPGWDLRVWGCVEEPVTWDLDGFRALPRTSVRCDIHCVTTWTMLDTEWEGVALSAVLDRVRPTSDCTHVVVYADGEYTTNLPLDALRAPDVLLADRFAGAPLPPAHGAPVRLVVPSLYFWKSAKWVRGLEFTATDRPGFWEQRGYSNSADPWQEERYAF